jgi:hypothetical protein
MNTATPSIAPKKEYRDFQKLEDKGFYAAYLNTAKQNVFIILKDLSDRLGLSMQDNDDRMLHAGLWDKLKENDETFTPKIIDHLTAHFRFLKYTVKDYAQVRAKNDLEEPAPEDYYLILRKWIEQLLAYRNYYTHASHDPVCLDSHVMWDLKGLYYKDWQGFKKQKNLGEKDVLHLDGRDKTGKEKPGFQYAFQGKDGITEKGLLYFTCLWLERRHAQEFLKKHKGFKDSRKTKMKATLEFFTHWSLIVPKPKVTSDHSEQGLFLDMLNDLQRCPKLLFDLLSPDHQKLFERSKEDHESEEEGYRSE